MINQTNILLLQSIESKTDFIFDDPLELWLSHHQSGNYFCIDNFSDSISIMHAKQFIAQSEHLLLVCEASQIIKLGSWSSIMNQCIRKPHVEMIFLKPENPMMKAFIKKFNGNPFNSAEEMIQFLNQKL